MRWFHVLTVYCKLPLFLFTFSSNQGNAKVFPFGAFHYYPCFIALFIKNNQYFENKIQKRKIDEKDNFIGYRKFVHRMWVHGCKIIEEENYKKLKNKVNGNEKFIWISIDYNTCY